MQLLAVTLHDPFIPILNVFDTLLYVLSAIFRMMFTVIDLTLGLVIW